MDAAVLERGGFLENFAVPLKSVGDVVCCSNSQKALLKTTVIAVLHVDTFLIIIEGEGTEAWQL